MRRSKNMGDAKVACTIALVALGALAGCESVPRAVIAPVLPAQTFEVAPPPDAQKLVYRAPASRLHVYASDLLNGDHSITFASFRGVVEIDATRHGRFRLSVDMRTLRAENDYITDFAKYDLLEVDKYPHATIVAQIEPGDAPDALALTGNIVLHGVEHGIRFTATLTRINDHAEVHAVWKMSRVDFAMRARKADWIIQNDIRVTLDLRAGPERVTVEPLP
jgi:polyisoprenoid-binding protein YceI